MKNERIAILSEIDRLNQHRCSNCVIGFSNSAKATCDCDADIKIRSLGDRLMRLINRRESEILLESLTDIHKLTVDDYIKLKEAEVPDLDISKSLGVGRKIFARWRRENQINGMLKGETKNG